MNNFDNIISIIFYVFIMLMAALRYLFKVNKAQIRKTSDKIIGICILVIGFLGCIVNVVSLLI